MAIIKQNGDSIGATVTFDYKGPGTTVNVGANVLTSPAVTLSQQHYCPASTNWSSQSVSLSGLFSGINTPGTMINVWKWVKTLGEELKLNSTDLEVYEVYTELVVLDEFQNLSATYT